MKILFVHQGLHSFVKKDLDILQEAHEVRCVELEWSFAGLFSSLFHLWKGVVWCDITFSWFGKLHAFFAVLFSKMLGKKSIVIAGGDDVARVPEIKYGMFYFWWKKWCPSFVFRCADLVIPVSRFTEKMTLANAKADPEKMKMIYHGFLSNIHKISTAFAKENIVISIGAVSGETIAVKGLRLFVESAKLLPDTKFLLIGPDKDGALSHLKEIAPENVEFLGGIYGKDLFKICSKAKVYVQASAHESFGCSLAEAMLCECIPVVSRNGAIPEVVGDTGIYLDELTPEDISEKIKYAISLSDAYGKRARARIVEMFPLERRKVELLKTVESVCPNFMSKEYKRCARCVMDTTSPEITFDENGVCNICKSFERKLKNRVASKEENEKCLPRIINQIKIAGSGKKYDCVIGVSGGVDSTYVAYSVKKMGLRPLAVHFDNGWDSELAVNNIERTLKKLNIELYTHVIDWDSFRDLQLAFLKASTPDGEIPTDHAITALLYDIADKYNIKYIILGTNFRTEGIMPATWAYGHFDRKYINEIHDLFGTSKLIDFPYFNMPKLFYYTFIRKIRMIAIFSYIDFNKKTTMQVLDKELGWRDYGGKHCESIYTKFYQAYILPKKFNIDKRKAHLSSIICSTGEISREEALEELKKEPYRQDEMREERTYVIKKLGLTEKEFDEIMVLPPKTFKDYHTNYKLIKIYKDTLTFFRNIGLLYR